MEEEQKTPVSVWVQVRTEDGEDIGGKFKIKPVPEDVDDFRKAVKAEMAPKLDYLAAAELKVFPAGTVDFNGPPLRADAVVPVGSSAAPVIVVAPAPEGSTEPQPEVTESAFRRCVGMGITQFEKVCHKTIGQDTTENLKTVLDLKDYKENAEWSINMACTTFNVASAVGAQNTFLMASATAGAFLLYKKTQRGMKRKFGDVSSSAKQ